MQFENRESVERKTFLATLVLKEVLPYAPDAEIVYWLSESENGSLHFEDAFTCLFRNNLQFLIRKSSYPQSYDITPVYTIPPYMDRDNLYRIKRQFSRPNNIGVLSQKKIDDWVTYGTNYCRMMGIENERNGKIIADFLSEIRCQPDVQWGKDNQSGYIYRNGIEFKFSIKNTKIHQEISCLIPYGDLETFFQLADNKYIKNEN